MAIRANLFLWKILISKVSFFFMFNWNLKLNLKFMSNSVSHGNQFKFYFSLAFNFKLTSKTILLFYHFENLIWSMWPISANINLFIILYECSQPLKLFYTQICIQHMPHWRQIQLVHSFLLSFTEDLFDMKGSVIKFMEKCNICILLHQCLNETISHLTVRHGLFFHRSPFAYVHDNKLFKEIWK